MKTIIAGSRDIVDYEVVKKAIKESGFTISELISGGARGVDRLGESYAKENNIPIKRFIPDWDIGKHAGILRNQKMAEYAEALIAIWDGESRGTKNMIEEARFRNLNVYVYNAVV